MPRATLDIDIMVELGALFRTKRAVEELGFTVGGAPMEFNDGKVQIYRLTKIDALSAEVLVLDLVIVTPEMRQVWEGRLEVEWEEGTLSVVSPVGLIFLKSLRNSGQDRDDIEYLRSITDED